MYPHQIQIDGVTYNLTKEQSDEIKNMVSTNFILVQKTFEKINHQELSFYIKPYQRGYRWTETEILELLNDINDIDTTKNEKYSLQPLIVKHVDSNKDNKYRNTIADIINNNNSNSSVKINCPNCYEVIDGQQRLTTMCLILRYLNSENSLPYQIYYELMRNIDNYYLNKAVETIEAWFEDKSADFKKTFSEKINHNLFFIWYEIIENESNATEKRQDSKAIFKTINDNQIALTNAELFKALLLNPENTYTFAEEAHEKIKKDILLMAFEWDRLEQELQDQHFWSFICNNECNDRTHLDFLFELYASKIQNFAEHETKKTRGQAKKSSNEYKKLEYIKNLNPDITRYSFLTVKAYLEYLNTCNKNNNVFSNIKIIWCEIKSCYEKLYSWYNNYELYHYIGFLGSASSKKDTDSIVPDKIKFFYINNHDKTLPVVITNAKKEIYNTLKSHIEIKPENSDKVTSICVFEDELNPNYYTNNKPKNITEFLLFFNVWTTMKQKSLDVRFPFRDFKFSKCEVNEKLISTSWDVEHISSRNLKVDLPEFKDENAKALFIEWWIKEIDLNNEDDDQLKTLYENIEKAFNSDDLVSLKDCWGKYAQYQKENGGEDNSISNLTLLDSSTNRSYGNAFFLDKRSIIIEKDSQGKYIPIGTKNVFLKYYTDNPKLDAAWNQQDRECYSQQILACIKDLQKFMEDDKVE